MATSSRADSLPSQSLTRAEAIALAKGVANTVAAALGHRSVRSVPLDEDPWTMVAAGTAVTICDGLAAVIAVVESKGSAHAPTIARGIIESLLDLALICRDSRNVLRLLRASLRGTRRYLETAKGFPDEAVAGDREATRALLAEVNQHLDSLKNRGIVEIGLEEKFENTGDYSVLRFYYRKYIAHVHNNFDAIFSRHFRGTEIKLGDALSDSDVLELLSITSLVTSQILKFLPRFTNMTEKEAAERLNDLQGVLAQLASGKKASRATETPNEA